jgi:hypothetical protein
MGRAERAVIDGRAGAERYGFVRHYVDGGFREGNHAFEFYCETEVVHIALGTHSIPKIGLGGSDEAR